MEKRKEFKRLFSFIVKHHGALLPWENRTIKKLLRWALFYKKIFILYDGNRIAAVAIAWRTTHPENSYEDMSLNRTESGDFLHVYRVIIHPEYRGMGLMFQLLVMGMIRFRGVKTIFWEQRQKSGKTKLIIQPIDKVLKELTLWVAKTPSPPQSLKSKRKA